MSKLLRRVILGTGANAYGQIITIVIQIISVPVFLSQWNTETYGQWLILSAVPTYLSLSDFGLITAAGNRINMLISRGEFSEARRAFHSAVIFSLSICAILGVLILIWSILPNTFVSDRDAKNALSLLVAAIAFGQIGGLAEAIFKATKGYAIASGLSSTARLFEWGGYILGLYVDGGFVAVAFAGLCGRLIVVILGLVWSSNRHVELSWGVRDARLSEVRSMVKPGLSFLFFSLANAFTFQGFTLLSGAILGPAATVVFTTYRTLARVAVQMTSMLSHALWPEFAILFGQRRFEQLALVYRRSFLINTSASVLLSAVLYVIGGPLLEAWTHGAVTLDAGLLFILLLYAAIAGCTHLPRVLLMSTNNHISLGNLFVLISSLSILIGWLLAESFGLTGLATAMTIAEVGTLASAVFLLRRLVRNLSISTEGVKACRQ